MAIPPVEKICPRCQTRFFGRKNKVFCSETCKVDANNEKLKQAYYIQHGAKTTNKKNETNYADKVMELQLQIKQLQHENRLLKDALHAKGITKPNKEVVNQKKKLTKEEKRRMAEGEKEAEKIMELLKEEEKVLDAQLRKQQKSPGK